MTKVGAELLESLNEIKDFYKDEARRKCREAARMKKARRDARKVFSRWENGAPKHHMLSHATRSR